MQIKLLQNIVFKKSSELFPKHLFWGKNCLSPFPFLSARPLMQKMNFWTMHFGNKFAKTDKNNIGPQMLQKITFL
jgi:hypothetical protein